MEQTITSPVRAAQAVGAGRGDEVRTGGGAPSEQRKRELFAIESHLSRVVVAAFNHARMQASPTGLFAAPAFGSRFAGAGTPVAAIPVDEPLGNVHSRLAGFGTQTVIEFDRSNIAVLDAEAERANVRRAAQLLEELPPRNREERFATRSAPREDSFIQYELKSPGLWVETDASYVYRHIRPGIAFQVTFNAQTLTNVIAAVLKVDPLITYSEITRIAARSEGLLMQPARLNETQLGVFLTALSIPPEEEGKTFGDDSLFRKPHPDHYVYDQAGGRVRYRKPPEEFKVLRDEKRPGRRHRLRFWLRKPDTHEQVTRTVASFNRDARDLESAEGCPGRVPSKPGELAPVRANYQNEIRDLAPAWAEAFPVVRLERIPSGLAPSIGSTNGFQLDIEGITGIRVEIRASQTGRMSLEADSQETVDGLNFASHEYGLNIRMNSSTKSGLSHSVNGGETSRFVIIRVPRVNLLRSVGNSSLETCRAYFLDADVPENATLIAEAETARVVARPGSRVFAMTNGRTDIEAIGPNSPTGGGRARLVVLATSAAKEAVRIGGRAADSVRISRIGSGETAATVREAQLVRVLLGRNRRWLNRYPKEMPPAPATLMRSFYAAIQ